MLATFRETINSVRDLEYGSKIVERSVKSVFWYWYKYVLLFAGIMLFLALGSVVYFTPQLTKIASEKLPAFDLSVLDGLATTTMKQPQMFVDSDIAFILNTKGKSTDLDNYQNGAIVLADRVIFKNVENGVTNTKELKWADMGDFTVDKNSVVSWLAANKTRMLLVFFSVVIIFGLILFGLYTLGQIVFLAVSSVLFLIIAKILKKKLTYTQVVRLVFYSSVISLLVGVLNLFLPSQILSTLSLGLFVFYTCAWIYKLK